ncbi:protein mab-21 [Caerostris extrusa]|uniref:Protein mab-21 n=1 Tax=Caerostris extrusa TaxID=172846 RepID=A0AAV4WIU7_CAEEX|nr:protein mab-21 [Caerostris extrusa]
MVADTTEVKPNTREIRRPTIRRPSGAVVSWPRSAAHWPIPQILWPNPNLVAEASRPRDSTFSQRNASLYKANNHPHGSRCCLEFTEAENRLLQGGCRTKCLSILKTMRDRHFDLPGNPVTSYHMKTLVLYECEKHARELEWMKLVSEIVSMASFCNSFPKCNVAECPHYFTTIGSFQGKSVSSPRKCS